eukprot:s5559_g4.t1
MLFMIIHGLNPNSKLKAILEACASLRYLWSPHVSDHAFFMQDFFQPNSVYIRFTHIQNLQPKFYIGSSANGVMSREHSRFRKFLQLGNDRLVQAELSLRYWHEQNSLFTWAPLPIFLRRPDFRSLELALIQEWQPRLNYPFICQFFHPRKGLLKRPAMRLNPQFGLATLWRKRRHKFTPACVKEILSSPRFQNRLEMWKLIHDLGSNTKSRFEATKFLRSLDGGLTMCYALRRLASNIQEPFRTLSLQAIDATITWWKGKPAPKATAIRLPWSLSPDLERTVSRFLRSWFYEVLAHHAVLDILCNHKLAMTDWSLGNTPPCCCKDWTTYKSACLNANDAHWVLSGALLAPLVPEPLRPLCSGSLLNKVFPSKRDYGRQMAQSFKNWARTNGLPSIPSARFHELIDQLWSSHKAQLTSHLTKSSISQLQELFPQAIFHCEDKHASSLRIFCPALYYEAIEKTFMDPQVFCPSEEFPTQVVDRLVDHLQNQFGRTYPWAVGRGRQIPSGYILSKAKKAYHSGRPIISFVDAPFRPMLNILSRSPMGSPLSPAMCLMVVSISEEIWFHNFQEILSNHDLFIRHIRYVDNRLLLGDPRLVDLPPYETLLDEGFYGRPILLETEPDQEFLGFMIATEPFELIYCGPTDTSQVLSPFSASPPKVLLSGFRSRCHIVAKGAHPIHRVHAGIQQLIDLYTLAGFEANDLQTISSQILLDTQ